MALINCKECGNEISDTAFTCPGCGASVELMNKAKKFFWWNFRVAMLVLASMAGLAIMIISVVKYLG